MQQIFPKCHKHQEIDGKKWVSEESPTCKIREIFMHANCPEHVQDLQALRVAKISLSYSIPLFELSIYGFIAADLRDRSNITQDIDDTTAPNLQETPISKGT